MTIRLTLLVAHVTLLLLASTCFTAVTGVGDGEFQWECFRYFSQNGWGVAYQFPYSLCVVIAYVAAYAIGVAAYCMAWRNDSQIIGLAGMLLCGIGFVSFAVELTHWFVPHFGSWIATAPIALLALAAVAAIQQYWRREVKPIGHELK